ncbi:DUF6531 domain-containing protein [Candidatus Nitrospira salsa]
MCRRVSFHLVVWVFILTVVGTNSCAPSEKLQGQGSDNVTSQQYGWWVGHFGKEAAVDIGFRGEGTNIEVVRSYISNARIDSPIGMRWTHNYLMHIRNASDNQLKLFDANGSSTLFTLAERGTFISKEETPRVIKQNGDGTHTLHDETGVIYGFNQKGRLVHIQGHQYGNALSVAYGADGYLESISDAEGKVITFYYDPETHRLTSIRDGQGRSATYKHDDIGNLISVSNAEGIISAYSYDRQSHLVGVTFP